MNDTEHEDPIYSQPMTQEQRFRQEVLMYVRDKIISPIMPPVKKYEAKLDIWLKSRDGILISKMAKKHTDEIIALFTKAQQQLLDELIKYEITLLNRNDTLIHAVPVSVLEKKRATLQGGDR